MPLPSKNHPVNRWLPRLLRVVLLISIAIGFLLCLTLFLLPYAVSTDWSQRLIQNKASEALGRPLQFERLTWSWTEGVFLQRLVIPDLPEFSKTPLISIEQVRFQPDIKKLLSRQAAVTLRVSKVGVNIVTEKNGMHNVEMLVGKKEKPSDLTEKKRTSEKNVANKPVALPSLLKDISFQVHFEKINILYDNRTKSEVYGIKNLEFQLNTASLKNGSVDLRMGADIDINNHILPHSTVTASIQNLFDEQSVLRLEGVSGTFNATLPGMTAQLNADLAASKAKVDFRLELDAFMEAVAPLVPDFPSETKISGRIECKAGMGTDPKNPLEFDVFVSGTDLSVSGTVVDGKTVGPGNFTVKADGIVDLQGETADLKTAEIRILENGRFQVSATAERIKNENRKVHLEISKLFMDLDETLSFVRPLLPSTINTINRSKRNAVFSIDSLTMEGQFPKGPSDVRLSGLRLNLPEIAISDESNLKKELQVSGGEMKVDTLWVRLTDLFPESAKLSLSLRIDDLSSINEEDELAVSGIRLNRFNAKADKLTKAKETDFGITGNFLFDHQLEIDRGKFSDLLQVDHLTQFLKGTAELLADNTIFVSLDSMEVAGNTVTVLIEDLSPISTKLDIHAASRKIMVNNLDPLNVDVHDFQANVDLEEAFGMSLSADLLHLPTPRIDMDVTLTSDLEALLRKIPPELQQGITGSGDLKLALSLLGRQPNQRETEALKKRLFTNNLSFIDRLRLDGNVTDGAISLPLPENNRLEIRSINAGPLIKYELDGNTGKGNLISNITAGGITGLQGLNASSSVSGHFSFTADHTFSKSIGIQQSLSISPAGVKETASLSIEGLDRFIDQPGLPKLSDLVTTLGAELSTTLTIPESRELDELGLSWQSDIDINGPVEASIRFRLSPNRSVGGTLSIIAKTLDLHLPERISIEKLDVNLDFSKFYDILQSDRITSVAETPDLSSQVIGIGIQAKQLSNNTRIQKHIRKLHERTNPDPAVSFQKANIMVAPFPLAIEDSVMMLNIDNGLPNLDFFQFNLLGGSLNGSLSLVKGQKAKQQDFNVNTVLTFSGIDMAQIFPEAFPEADQVETDISGALYANLPATDRVQTLLENTAMTVEFTEIGAMALERFLFSLDPYDSNETIVSQRRLLKTGTPKSFKMEIKDGFLTLSGSVSVKGIDISMPALRRLNIAQIPGMDQFEGNLSDMVPVITILKKIASQKIVVNKIERTISFE